MDWKESDDHDTASMTTTSSSETESLPDFDDEDDDNHDGDAGYSRKRLPKPPSQVPLHCDSAQSWMKAVETASQGLWSDVEAMESTFQEPVDSNVRLKPYQVCADCANAMNAVPKFISVMVRFAESAGCSVCGVVIWVEFSVGTRVFRASNAVRTLLGSVYMASSRCVEADEMGLGKSCQAVRFLSDIMVRQEQPTSSHAPKPALILVPLSIVQDWVVEWSRFAVPGLPDLLVYHGDPPHRASLRHRPGFNGMSVVLTTLELFNKDFEYFDAIHWYYVVVDEAHRLKNIDSLSSLHVGELNKAGILLLTGTPIHNNMLELNALLHLSNPHLFPRDPAHLMSLFGGIMDENHDPHDRQTLFDTLHQLLKPFILRREKDVVLKNLPVKRDLVFYTGISELQKRLYKAILAKDHLAISVMSSSTASQRTSLNNILIHLRKCVNHPYLFPSIEPEPFVLGEHLMSVSGKLWLLDRLLPYLKERRHRVLMFSQMTRMLDILQDFIQYRDWSYERLDGSVRGEERFLAVRKFNSMDSDTFIFLLSTRAGGVGLNLATADTIIFFDSDFNPQMDLQAASRAHRIGQSKEVTVIRLLTRGTVEEIIFRRAQQKLKLSQNILQQGLFAQQPGLFKPFTRPAESSVIPRAEELASILKFGLDKLMENEFGTISDSDLDQIMTLEMAQAPLADHFERAEDPEDRIYVFEGHDYSKTIVSDEVAFEKLKDLDTTVDDRKRKSSQIDFQSDVQQLELQRQLTKDIRKKERQEKLMKLWAENEYTSLSLAVPDPEIFQTSLSADLSQLNLKSHSEFSHRTSRRIFYVCGDVTRPQASQSSAVSIVVHVVDDSGLWTNRGVFGGLGSLSNEVPEKYSLAKSMKDLKVGDVHLIAVPESDIIRAGLQYRQILVALAVAQTRNVRSGTVSGIHFGHLETCLQKLAGHCISLQRQNPANIHLPRIGAGTPGFDWYRTERLLQKYFLQNDIQVFVYYFRRQQATRSDTHLSRNWTSERESSSGSGHDDNADEESDDAVTVDETDADVLELKEIAKHSLPFLPDFMRQQKIFFQYSSEAHDQVELYRELRRRLIAFGGEEVCEAQSCSAVVVLQDWHGNEFLWPETSTESMIVSAGWLVDSFSEFRLQQIEPYILTPTTCHS